MGSPGIGQAWFQSNIVAAQVRSVSALSTDGEDAPFDVGEHRARCRIVRPTTSSSANLIGRMSWRVRVEFVDAAIFRCPRSGSICVAQTGAS